MKLLIKILILIFTLLAITYYSVMFIMPSITIINNSGVNIEQAEIALPLNHLDFGSIEKQQKNTLHYSLEQNDGSYQYSFKMIGSADIQGSCGYVTNNEIHKRVFIYVNDKFEIVCEVK